MIEAFTLIPGAQALVRYGGVLKVQPVYARKARHYIPHRGGFVRICDQLGGEYVTSVTGLTVTELDLTGEPT